MSQSEYETIISNRRKARENVRIQVVIGSGFVFGFGFHWLKKVVQVFTDQS